MEQGPKFLLYLGGALIVASLVWQWGGKFLKLGRLPGDIVIEKENFKFYAPIATSLLISAVLTLIAWIISLFHRS
jgi:hypothetical protein